MKKEEGITLIALIITIIVLLILAGITITFTLGDNGILQKSAKAKEEYTKAQLKEEIELAIVDIQAEELDKTLDKDTIINTLPVKLEITIDDNMSGEYKGYDYYIDDNYVVHIGDKQGDSIKVWYTTKIGTSYITLTAKGSSTYGTIIEYIYTIDGVEIKSTEANYTVENLDPESTHTVKVAIVDEKNNKKEADEKTIKTEPRTYLYLNGEEYIALTGGWDAIYKTDDPGTPVASQITINKESQSMNASVVKSNGSIVMWGAAVGMRNRIEMGDYQYLCVTATSKLDYYAQASITEITLESIKPSLEYSQTICYRTPVTTKTTVKCDISQYEGQYNPAIYLQAQRNGGAEITIYEIWLEK